MNHGIEMLKARVQQLNRLVGAASLNFMNTILIAEPRNTVACSQHWSQLLRNKSEKFANVMLHVHKLATARGAHVAPLSDLAEGLGNVDNDGLWGQSRGN